MSETARQNGEESFHGTQGTPLSFQQRFYIAVSEGGELLNRLDGVFAFHLLGPLDSEALRKSINELVRRHDALRTRIVFDGQNLKQCINRPCDFNLDIIQLPISRIGRSGVGIQAQHLIEEISSRTADLSGKVLFEAKLLVVSEQEHVLIWAINHLISDHVTREMLRVEIWILYGAFVQGRSPSFQNPPMQYSDYCHWQHEAHCLWLLNHESYWKERLAGAVGIRWPRHICISGMKRYSVASALLSFPSKISERLRDFAKTRRTPLSLQMLAVYVAVISRWCNQMDFVVATTSTGRDRIEHQLTAGYFAHPIYLRMQLAGNETFIDLLAIVCREYYRALSHKDFGVLAMENPELSAGTLFQWFPELRADTFFPPTQTKLIPSDLTIEPYPVKPIWPLPEKYDCYIILWDNGINISALAMYQTNAFAGDVIQRLIADLRSTSERLLENPHGRVLPVSPSGPSAPASAP
jgi:hypothetical protein